MIPLSDENPTLRTPVVTIGLLLASEEDTTIVLTPSKWLSWSSSTVWAVLETSVSLRSSSSSG